MNSLILNTTSRTAMARKLAEAIRPHGVELRHAQATRVLATILDENQHTAAIRYTTSIVLGPWLQRRGTRRSAAI